MLFTVKNSKSQKVTAVTFILNCRYPQLASAKSNNANLNYCKQYSLHYKTQDNPGYIRRKWQGTSNYLERKTFSELSHPLPPFLSVSQANKRGSSQAGLSRATAVWGTGQQLKPASGTDTDTAVTSISWNAHNCPLTATTFHLQKLLCVSLLLNTASFKMTVSLVELQPGWLTINPNQNTGSPTFNFGLRVGSFTWESEGLGASVQPNSLLSVAPKRIWTTNKKIFECIRSQLNITG